MIVDLDAYRILLREVSLTDVFNMARAGDDLANRALHARLDALEAAILAGELDDYEDEQ